PDVFGYIGAVLISLLILLSIYIFTNNYEDKRRKEGTLIEEDYEEWQKPLPRAESYKFFSMETYHKFFVQRWSFTAGAILMAIIFIFIINSTGSSWGVTSPFALWGVWLFDKIGIDLSTNPAFTSAVE